MLKRSARLLLALSAAYLIWDVAIVRRARTVVAVAQRDADIPELRFDLLTYDIAGLPDLLSSYGASGFIERIGQGLQAYDLAVLQEDFAWHERLVRSTPHPFVVDPSPGGRMRFGDGLAALGRLLFERADHVPWRVAHGYLGSGFDELATKGFLHLQVRASPRVVLDVFTLHLDGGNSTADGHSRRAQLEQLAEAIESRAPGDAVVVAGNFNLRPSRAGDMALLEVFEARCGLRDAALELGIADDHVDRVLFRSGEILVLEPLRWMEPPEFRDEDGEPLSDHAPIHVRFRIVRNEPAPPDGR